MKKLAFCISVLGVLVLFQLLPSFVPVSNLWSCEICASSPAVVTNVNNISGREVSTQLSDCNKTVDVDVGSDNDVYRSATRNSLTSARVSRGIADRSSRPVLIGFDRWQGSDTIYGSAFTEVWLNTTVRDGKFYDSPAPLCVHALNNSVQCLPSLFVIGTLKAGTTSLHRYLRVHPQIRESPKEICKLGRVGYEKLTDYRNLIGPVVGSDDHPVPYRIHTQRDVPFAMEVCPFYLQRGYCEQLIPSLVPNARYLVMLRNPVDRLFSMFNMRVRYRNDGFNGDERFEDFVVCESSFFYVRQNCYSNHRRVQEFIEESMYAVSLARWFETVPPGPSYIFVKAEDFFASENTALFVRDIVGHLGLDPDALAQHEGLMEKAFNRTPRLHQKKMDPALRKRLEEFYRPYNDLLTSVTGIDFGYNAA